MTYLLHQSLQYAHTADARFMKEGILRKYEEKLTNSAVAIARGVIKSRYNFSYSYRRLKILVFETRKSERIFSASKSELTRPNGRGMNPIFSNQYAKNISQI